MFSFVLGCMQESLTGCSSSPCPNNHVCSSAESGAYQCQTTEFTDDGKNFQTVDEQMNSSNAIGCGMLNFFLMFWLVNMKF